MKKSIVALAVLGSFAGVAAAQSSVTLFGVIDLAARYTKANGVNTKQLASDGSSSSRFGVRGTEDLGGGLKAGFWLESALSADTGTTDATRFWARRASVSLMGDFGEVRLGRGKTSTRTLIDDFDVYGTVGLGDVTRVYQTFPGAATVPATPTALDNLNRSDNQVQYFLPGNIGGFYGSGEVAAGEGVDGKKSFGGRVGYKVDALNVSAGYQTTDIRGSKYKLASLGGSYDFGMVKASALLSEIKLGSLKQNIITVGAVVPVTAASAFTAQFSSAKTNGAADAMTSTAGDAKFYTAGYQYNLSKRTALYSTVSLIDNSGLTNFKIQSNAVTGVPSGRSSGFDVGMKHSF